MSVSLWANLPAELRNKIQSRRIPAGLMMSDDPSDEGDDPSDGGGSEAQDDPQLGPNGEKALKAERDARKAADAESQNLKKAIADALGIQGTGGKPTTDDIVATLQQQVATMQHTNLVLSVANAHKIDDEGDIDLLRQVTDETAMRKLAARLATTNDDQSATDTSRKPGKRTPAPDPSQGRGDGDAGRKSVTQIMADRAAARAAKTQPN